MSRLLPTTLIVLFLLAGCTTGPRITGRLADEPTLSPRVGAKIPTVHFRDGKGRLRDLAHLGRDATLFALIPGDEAELCERLKNLSVAAAGAQRLPCAYVGVVVVGQVSARAAAGCEEWLGNVTYIEALEKHASLWSAGPASGKWFVVDRRGRITAHGPVSDLSSLRRHLDAAVWDVDASQHDTEG